MKFCNHNSNFPNLFNKITQKKVLGSKIKFEDLNFKN